MDRLRAMEVFVQVVKRGSFVAAARKLGLSTTAVSRQVQQLEDSMGARLLHRTTRQVQLTDVGLACYQRCRQLVNDAEELYRETRDQRINPAGLLRVSAPLSFGQRHLIPALPRFLDRHPELTVNLLMTDRHVDLIGEGYDVALRITAKLDENLVARRLAPCRFAVVASPAYLQRHGMPAEPQELVRYNCILDSNIPAPDQWWFHDGTGAYSVKVRGNLSVSSADAALDAAQADMGITLIPTFVVGEAVADGRLVHLFPGQVSLETTAYVVYPHYRYLSTRVRVFVDFVSALFGDPPYWDSQLSS